MSHYNYLEKYLNAFWILTVNKSLEESGCAGNIGAHGDKCYPYRPIWIENNISFEHGVSIYLLSYVYPFSEEVRRVRIRNKDLTFTDSWVDPCDWVIKNYERFKPFLLQAEKEINELKQF